MNKEGIEAPNSVVSSRHSESGEEVSAGWKDQIKRRSVFAMGRLLVDIRRGTAKNIDTGKIVHVSPKEVTILRILDSGEWLNWKEIASMFEERDLQNDALINMFHYMDEVCRGIPAENNLKFKKNLDGFVDVMDGYESKNPLVLYTSDNTIWEQIYNIRKKIGKDLIEHDSSLRYRLKPLSENVPVEAVNAPSATQ